MSNTLLTALVIGATGGIGGALAAALNKDSRYARVLCLSRSNGPSLDLLVEASVERAAACVKAQNRTLDLILDATGTLQSRDAGGATVGPEKTIHRLDPDAMAYAYAVNAIGPALLLKHFAPLLPRDRRGVFATLSARVGSIGDNRLGGWYSYRASKAALNQIVRSAAIEIARKHRKAVVVCLHPGTVRTELSEPFAADRDTFTPAEAAAKLLAVIDRLTSAESGGHFAYDGSRIPD